MKVRHALVLTLLLCSCGDNSPTGDFEGSSMTPGDIESNSTPDNGTPYESIEIDVSKSCMRVGESSDHKVLGEKLNFDEDVITGKSIISTSNPKSVPIISHGGEVFTIHANSPGVVKLEATYNGKKDSSLIGVIPKSTPLPVIMKVGCSFVYYADTACGLAYKTDKGGGGFRISTTDGLVVVRQCKVLENSKNVPILDLSK